MNFKLGDRVITNKELIDVKMHSAGTVKDRKFGDRYWVKFDALTKNFEDKEPVWIHGDHLNQLKEIDKMEGLRIGSIVMGKNVYIGPYGMTPDGSVGSGTIEQYSRDMEYCLVRWEITKVAKWYKVDDLILVGPDPDKSVDNINHPPHYTFGKIEVIDVINDWQLSYNLSSVIKYVARAGRKDPSKTVEDLKKAASCLAREISMREGQNA